ncbi:MAG: Ig-like domain-containing protein, partial [Polyangiales bacterium]
MTSLEPMGLARRPFVMALCLVGASSCGAQVSLGDDPADAAAPAVDAPAMDHLAPVDAPRLEDRIESSDSPPPDDVPPDQPAAIDVAAQDASLRDASSPDATAAPSVRFTSPRDGDTVTGAVRLAATASAGVVRVAFFSAGGAYRIGEDRSPPFAIDWYTAGFVPDGAQRLRATAFDAAGRQASHDIDVRVRNAPSTALPAADLARVTAYFEARRGGRYLEGDCRDTTYPGWSGVPLRL